MIFAAKIVILFHAESAEIAEAFLTHTIRRFVLHIVLRILRVKTITSP